MVIIWFTKIGKKSGMAQVLRDEKIINVTSSPRYFFFTRAKFSLNTVSIRVKFDSPEEKVTTRRMYIYLIPDTKYAVL